MLDRYRIRIMALAYDRSLHNDRWITIANDRLLRNPNCGTSIDTVGLLVCRPALSTHTACVVLNT